MHTDTGSSIAANVAGNIALQPSSIRKNVIIRQGCHAAELDMSKIINLKQSTHNMCDSVDQSSAPLSAAPANTLDDVGE